MMRAFFCVLAMVISAMVFRVLVSAERTRIGYELEELRQQHRADAGRYYAVKASANSMRSMSYLMCAMEETESAPGARPGNQELLALLNTAGREEEPVRASLAYFGRGALPR